MKFDFGPGLADSDAPSRPYIDNIRIAGLDRPLTALVDSGSLGCRIDARIGRSAGLDLTLGSTQQLLIGGSRKLAHVLSVPIQLKSHVWTAEVAFVEDWTASYQVLGLYGFFTEFEVRIKASSQRFFILRK